MSVYFHLYDMYSIIWDNDSHWLIVLNQYIIMLQKKNAYKYNAYLIRSCIFRVFLCLFL